MSTGKIELLDKTEDTIKKYSMLSEGDHVLIGLSGGPDSVCLSIVLDRLKKDFALTLSAVYINHGLRPSEVEKEIKFCKQFCEERNISFLVKEVDVNKYAGSAKLNLQEAARVLRYKMLDEVANEIDADRIALGQHADDQAETVLMRLVRGSGRRGLSGIPPVRGKIIRPLIRVERKEIEAFLSLNLSGVTSSPLPPFMLDSSNLNDNYTRNWIRMSIMKELEKRNPSLTADICRTAEILREEDEYLEIIVTKTLMRLISRKSEESIELFLVPLETMERPILRRVLRRAVDAVQGLRGIGLVHIDNMIHLIKNGRNGDRLDLPKKIRAVKEYSLLKITSSAPVVIGEYELQPPCEVALTDAGMVIKAEFAKSGDDLNKRSSIVLDAGKIRFSLKVRHRVAGDFFFPAGFGKKKKLQDFFVDEKVPREMRDRVPIVLSGNDIIWVAGFRGDERFKVTGETREFLRLEVVDRQFSVDS